MRCSRAHSLSIHSKSLRKYSMLMIWWRRTTSKSWMRLSCWVRGTSTNIWILKNRLTYLEIRSRFCNSSTTSQHSRSNHNQQRRLQATRISSREIQSRKLKDSFSNLLTLTTTQVWCNVLSKTTPHRMSSSHYPLKPHKSNFSKLRIWLWLLTLLQPTMKVKLRFLETR